MTAEDEYFTADDLMAIAEPTPEIVFNSLDDLCRQSQQHDWLVKGLIECGTHGMLFGPPASGKTLVLFDIAYCVATGKKWRNKRVKQGAVFYLCGEGHGGLRRRARAWKKQNAIPSGNNYPIYYSNIPAALLRADSAAAVTTAIQSMIDKEGVTPVLIIIDTLARNFGPGNENSATDMGAVIANIDAQMIAGLGCAVITSHHSGVEGAERARGSSALLGALDVCYRIEKTGSKVEMEAMKVKDFEPMPPTAFRMKVHGLGEMDEDGKEITGATIAHPDQEAMA